MKKILIRDVTLRDGQQSQFATRMTQDQINRVLPLYAKSGFYACEVWGGAVPDSVMRYLNENPWHRLEKVKAGLGSSCKLTALSRGRNLFGYKPYSDDVIEGFFKNAMSSGLDIMRIFDALNDIDNMKASVKFVKKFGGMADCAVCYTVDPKFTFGERMRAFFKGKKLPKNLFTLDYFINKAKEMEKVGADMISIKDMAGLIPPQVTSKMIKAFKKELKIPVNLHTHCTPGYGLASVLVAILSGVDVIDTAIWNFAGGPAAPAFELVQIFATKLGIETGVDLKVVSSINQELLTIRKELAQFDTYQTLPREFDISNYKLPPEIDAMFDQAIELAKNEKFDELVAVTQKIDDYFKFPAPDEAVKDAEIPGGMYTNMLAQLKQGKLDHKFAEVLKLVPKVRLDAGCPPLVTPTSQIVGSQAVNLVLDEAKGKPYYTSKTNEFTNLVKGEYGKTPWPVDPDFREQIAGVRAETPYDTSKHDPIENPLLPEFGNVRLCKDEKDELLMELFPSVALGFLKKQREAEYQLVQLEAEKLRAEEEAKKPVRPPVKPVTVLTESMIEDLYEAW